MFRRKVLITSFLVVLTATAGLAQGRRVKTAKRDGFPAQRLERLQEKLNLTETQMNGLRALEENRRKESDSLRQEVQQKRQGLRQLMRQPNPNPTDVGNATMALKEIKERQRQINDRFLSGVKGLLTPDQVQKLPKRGIR